MGDAGGWGCKTFKVSNTLGSEASWMPSDSRCLAAFPRAPSEMRAWRCDSKCSSNKSSTSPGRIGLFRFRVGRFGVPSDSESKIS